MSDKNRLISVEIDEDTLGASGPDAEHERRVAIFDLIEQNSFALPEHGEGPFILALSKVERRLVFAVRDEHGKDVHTLLDYFMICDSYYDAIRTQSPHQIEAIDMARRGVHNEGSELLAERLQGKVEIDFLTARRLFTLICALHAGQARAAG